MGHVLCSNDQLPRGRYRAAAVSLVAIHGSVWVHARLVWDVQPAVLRCTPGRKGGDIRNTNQLSNLPFKKK